MILYKSPARAVAAPFCSSTFFYPPSLTLHLRRFFSLLLFFFLSRRLPSSSSRFSRHSCFLRSPSLLREARDRRSYRWQRGSFVLSRRFQLIFIVYLPDQRYLEDNGPPRYIRARSNLTTNTEVYLLFPERTRDSP